jgi:hypothetical protein
MVVFVTHHKQVHTHAQNSYRSASICSSRSSYRGSALHERAPRLDNGRQIQLLDSANCRMTSGARRQDEGHWGIIGVVGWVVGGDEFGNSMIRTGAVLALMCCCQQTVSY